LPGLLDSELVRAGWRALEPLARLDATIEGIEGDRPLIMTLELVWYLCCQLLRDTDWAGLAHSLEIRPPFVDVELFRRLLPLLVSAAPPVKTEVADCLRTPLLPAIRSRRKTGFVVPVRDWLMRKTGNTSRGLRGWA